MTSRTAWACSGRCARSASAASTPARSSASVARRSLSSSAEGSCMRSRKVAIRDHGHLQQLQQLQPVATDCNHGGPRCTIALSRIFPPTRRAPPPARRPLFLLLNPQHEDPKKPTQRDVVESLLFSL